MSTSRVVAVAARLAYELGARHLPPYISWGTPLRVWLAGLFIESAASTSVINEGVRLSRGVSVGERAGIGARSEFFGMGRISIGPAVMMGPQCLFITLDHPGSRFGPQETTVDGITIEDHVFLGARVTILPGVTVGRGATVGAGSVIAKDVAPGVTVVGNPARVVRNSEPQADHGP